MPHETGRSVHALMHRPEVGRRASEMVCFKSGRWCEGALDGF